MPWAATLLFTTLLCALGVAQASAQNAVSQRLLELDDAQRNEAFTIMLNESNRRCDQVMRTLFSGSVLGVDERHAVSSNQREGGFTERWPLCRRQARGSHSDLPVSSATLARRYKAPASRNDPAITPADD